MLPRHLLRLVPKHKPYSVCPNALSLNFSEKSCKTQNFVKYYVNNFHLASNLGVKLFFETENDFLYRIVDNGFLHDTQIIQSNEEISDESSFNILLERNWRNSNGTEVLNTFKRVKQFCINNNINVSDPRFDKLVDGLMDHCDKLGDNELLELINCLSQYPYCESYMAHNFHDIWSCLDDICCWKLSNWDIDQCLSFGDAWFKLSMAKHCDYIFELLDKLTKKAEQLTKDQLVHIFFFHNACRRRPVDFEYEHALQSKIKDLNIDEMAVVALGYFKTKSKIKLMPIMQAMVHEVTRTCLHIHEISLTAIMKILRLSHPGPLSGDIHKMLDALYPELERFSELCVLHVAHLGTGLQLLHTNTLRKCSHMILQNISNTRLKEIERILAVLTMFNFDPQTNPDIFKAAIEELHKNSRLAETTKFPRSLTCAIYFLSLKEIYSFELLNRVLNWDFITMHFGKQPKVLPREILCLDASIDIDCPDYKGSRLPIPIRYKATKWQTDYTPSYHQWQKLSAFDQFILTVVDTVTEIVGNKALFHVEHVLPHYPKADIILCRDTKTGKLIEPKGFERYTLGDVMVPFNDGTLRWYAIMVVGWNMTVRDSSVPLGNVYVKERQLKKIGYHPVMVIWNQFMRLSPKEKARQIREKLDEL